MSMGTFCPLLSDFPPSHRNVILDLFTHSPQINAVFNKTTGLHTLDVTLPANFPFVETASKLYSQLEARSSVKRKKEPQIRTIGWILRLINEIYDSRFASYEQHTDVLPIAFPDFVYSFLKSKFGVSALLSKFEEDFFRSLRCHSKSHAAVNLFLCFLLGQNSNVSDYSDFTEVELSLFLLARSRLSRLISPPKAQSLRNYLPPKVSSSISRLPSNYSSKNLISAKSMLIPSNALNRVAFSICKSHGSSFVSDVIQRCRPLCFDEGISSDVFLKIYVETLVDSKRGQIYQQDDVSSHDESTPHAPTTVLRHNFVGLKSLKIPASASFEDLLSLDIPSFSESPPLNEAEEPPRSPNSGHESLKDFMMRSVNIAFDLSRSPRGLDQNFDEISSDLELDYEYVEDEDD
ncbi:hypothetical protein RCL1_008556 [Eukaryota sp. TZLM3-RCL]